MARTSENKRHSKYVIRIVCEGDKTEPLFFTDLCDRFYGDSKDFDVRTIPQPNIPVEEDVYKRQGRHNTSVGCLLHL